MPIERLESWLADQLDEMGRSGRLKGRETVVRGIVPASGDSGPRLLLEDDQVGERPFLRMNSNGYLGLAGHPAVLAAEEEAVEAYGTGPGAVRFISGTWRPHLALEARLAAFHGREAAMIFSSAYATVMGVLPPLVTADTLVISDELNHNSIINAIRLSRPKERKVYRHLALDEIDGLLAEGAGSFKRALVVTDGIFSMRGDHAPLDEIMALARRYDEAYPENVVVVADDSHGVGAFGASGRGTEEHCGGTAVDLLIATLGKALGVNGGYVVGPSTVVDYLRETSPFYIYSNPITPSEAAAAARAIEVLDSEEGRGLLAHLRAMTRRFEQGLTALGLETIPGEHPVVPLMVRDTARTQALVAHLRASGILATGLSYPVVPKGDEEIRFQVSAEHTPADIDEALAAIAAFQAGG